MKKLIQLKLRILAKMILAKYQPEVIGITGSVGKTSTKEAIYYVLKTKLSVRRNIKNYNNEIGLPLTIIGINSPGKSLLGWVRVFIKAAKLLIIKDPTYPKILILEMGADKPGDMEYLTGMVKCKIGVVTMIGPVHLEQFGSIEKIQSEKSILLKGLIKSGWAIINRDDERVMAIANKIRSNGISIITFGLSKDADMLAQEVKLSFNRSGHDRELKGLSYKLSYQGAAVPVLLPKVLGRSNVYATLAAVAVAMAYGFNLIEAASALKNYLPPKGRMNLINGIKNTLIIDDTYNASPQSTIAALNTLNQLETLKGAQKYAVLGDMLELGSLSVAGHREVGRVVAEAGINKLIAVGERASDIARGAVDAGMAKDSIFHFAKAEEAGKFIQDRLNQDDVILVKGSQGIRMEKVVLEIMAEPLRAKELLVRQDELWQK